MPATEDFTGVTLVIPVVTETESLRETVDIAMENSSGNVGQIVLVVCQKTTDESLAECRRIANELRETVVFHEQRRPLLGNAIREAFELADESHVVMMASDLETDPRTLPLLIRAAKENPDAVVTASRWMLEGSFSDYGRFRVALNLTFQSLAQLMYQTTLTDLTFGYRLFPTKLVQAIRWEGESHNLLLETILKPLRLNVPVLEVPTSWRPRREGESQNNLAKQAEYLSTLFRCRFMSRGRILPTSPSTVPETRAEVLSS